MLQLGAITKLFFSISLALYVFLSFDATTTPPTAGAIFVECQFLAIFERIDKNIAVQTKIVIRCKPFTILSRTENVLLRHSRHFTSVNPHPTVIRLSPH